MLSGDRDQPGHLPSLSLCCEICGYVTKDARFFHADSKDSDQTELIPRPIRVFLVCTLLVILKITILKLVLLNWLIIWASSRGNLSSGLLTKRVSNQSPQLQRLARKLKFHP